MEYCHEYGGVCADGSPCNRQVKGGLCWDHGGEGESTGRKRIELTDEQLDLLEGLASTGLTQEEAARCLPISYGTLRDRLNEGDNAVSDIYERVRERYHHEIVQRERHIAFGRADKLDVDHVPVSEQRKTLKWMRKSNYGVSEKQQLEHMGEDGGPVEIKEVEVRVPESENGRPDD